MKNPAAVEAWRAGYRRAERQSEARIAELESMKNIQNALGVAAMLDTYRSRVSELEQAIREAAHETDCISNYTRNDSTCDCIKTLVKEA